MSFAHPFFLVALLGVPAVLLWWLRAERRSARLLRSISRGPAPGPRYAVAMLAALACAAAIVAAAQPRWGERDAFIPRNGGQVVVVLDVSRSMSVADVAPSRLAAAKTALGAILTRLGGDRFALVTYAGSARLRIPLTTDFVAAGQVVRELETGQILVDGGTRASSGLDLGLSAFDPASDAGRLLVIITDGDDLGADPAAAAQRLRSAGVDLVVFGVGTAEGGVVQVLDQRTGKRVDKLDASGKPIISKLGEPFLRSLAAASGGRYGGSDLRVLPGVIEGRLSALKRARFDQQAATLPVERYAWFAGAALVFLSIATVVERMPRRASGRLLMGAGATLVALFGGACATAAHDRNEEGLAAFARGDFAVAEGRFLEARAGRAGDATVSLNLAASLHAQGKYEEANQAARRALQSRDRQLRGQAYASIGHHRFAENDLPGALDAFRQALIENPKDEASRHDFEVVLRLLEPEPPKDPSAQPGESPTPDGTQASETPTPGGANARGTPTAGGTEPTPSPSSGGGSPTAAPGQGGQPGNQPGGQGGGPAEPLSPQDADRLVRGLDARIASLLDEAGDNPTAAQAVAILNLLADRQRILAVRDGAGGRGDPNDY